MVKSAPLPPVDDAARPLVALLCAAGGNAASAIALVMDLDQRCAAIVRGARELTMGQIRIAWWREALAAEQAGVAASEPLVSALRAHPRFAVMEPYFQHMLDGWEAFLVADGQEDEPTLRAFAQGRGNGIFGAIHAASNGSGDIGGAGCLWALWDLAGHINDTDVALRALALARDYTDAPPLPRPLAMLRAMALPDVRTGRIPPARLAPRLYMRLLRAQLFGR